ncbi:MAG: QueT transporter family protein [Lachnospiraceae bacterium]|nr:QueT transporter family protein [Lachnospiraceae bacterium]
MKNKKVLHMVQGAAIAAIYVILVVLFNYWSFGPIQFRIAEALTILPFFTPAAIPGLFVGCILANLLGGAIPADIVFGSLATLIGALGSYALRKHKWLVPLPPIAANTLIVPFILKFGYGAEEAIPYMMLTVGLGEVIVCAVIGLVFLHALSPLKHRIFGASPSC